MVARSAEETLHSLPPSPPPSPPDAAPTALENNNDSRLADQNVDSTSLSLPHVDPKPAELALLAKLEEANRCVHLSLPCKFYLSRNLNV